MIRRSWCVSACRQHSTFAAFILATIFFGLSSRAEAQSLTLVWNPNPEPDIAGYTVHVGTQSGVYTQTFKVGGRTTTFVYTQAVAGRWYYFAVSAFNRSNVSSRLSYEVVGRIDAAPRLMSPGDQTSDKGTAVVLQLAASDRDGDPLKFRAVGLPHGLALNGTSGRITGTPTTIGTYTVRVAVSDAVRTTSRTFTWTITGKLAITALTSNKASPQKAGTLIIFAVTVSGGTSPYQYKWWLSDGTNTTQLTNWGSHPSYAWTPHQAKSNYHVTVWARSSGSTSDAADGSRSISFAITSGTSGSRLHFGGVSADVRSPQPVGTAINLKAGATGGVTPYQYKWWLWDGAVWKVIRSWSTRSTLTWTPTRPNPRYRVGVWVRRAGVTADAPDDFGWIDFKITGSTRFSLNITSVTSNRSSPQVAGTAITFTTVVSGGVGPYQYKWWLWDGVAWTVLRNWASGNTLTWTPTRANKMYRIGVWARSAGVTRNVPDDFGWKDFTITGSSTRVDITRLSSNRPSPQPIGTPITFSVTATRGVTPYQYKWWLWDGIRWTVLRGWSTGATLTWAPPRSHAMYRIGVWARGANVISDTPDDWDWFDITTTP